MAMHLRRQKIHSAFTGAALAHTCHDRERLRAPLAGFIRCTAPKPPESCDRSRATRDKRRRQGCGWDALGARYLSQLWPGKICGIIPGSAPCWHAGLPANPPAPTQPGW